MPACSEAIRKDAIEDRGVAIFNCMYSKILRQLSCIITRLLINQLTGVMQAKKSN